MRAGMERGNDKNSGGTKNKSQPLPTGSNVAHPQVAFFSLITAAWNLEPLMFVKTPLSHFKYLLSREVEFQSPLDSW